MPEFTKLIVKTLFEETLIKSEQEFEYLREIIYNNLDSLKAELLFR